MSNYTPAMIAKLQAAAPLNLKIAKDLAADFGVSHRSVISKAKSLGLEYVKATPKARAAKGITKAELTDAIRQAVALPDRSGDLTKAELDVVLSNLS
jgi:Zn-dependent peptidase ImmA (M78 family)